MRRLRGGAQRIIILKDNGQLDISLRIVYNSHGPYKPEKIFHVNLVTYITLTTTNDISNIGQPYSTAILNAK